MANNLFSWKRFGLLLRKTIAERPMQNVGVIALLLVLSIILYIVVKRLLWFSSAQNITFIWGLAGGGFFLASFVFGYFNTNANGSSYLTLPASFLEKWLCAILIAGVIYVSLFLLSFHLTDSFFVSAYHESLDPHLPFYQQQYDSVYTFDLNGIIAWKVYSLYIILTGVMLIGGLYFNKIPFIKTAIAFCLFAFAIIGINWLLANTMFYQMVEAGPYDHVRLMVGKQQGVIILPQNIEKYFHYCISFIIPSILWFLPLIRLREKEF